MRMRSLARDEIRACLCSNASKVRDSAALVVSHSGTRRSRKQVQITTRWCVVQVAQMRGVDDRYKILWLKCASGYKIYPNARDEANMGRPVYFYRST